MKRIAGWGPLASREVDLIIFGGDEGKIYSLSFFKISAGPTIMDSLLPSFSSKSVPKKKKKKKSLRVERRREIEFVREREAEEGLVRSISLTSNRLCESSPLEPNERCQVRLQILHFYPSNHCLETPQDL